jgi:hypothetical protein
VCRFIATPALESFPSLSLSQSHQLKTWLSRLPISSSRLSRKVQRQSGQHQIPVSFSRPLGQKDATGRQSLASCSTSSLPPHKFAVRGLPLHAKYWLTGIRTLTDLTHVGFAGRRSDIIVGEQRIMTLPKRETNAYTLPSSPSPPVILS